jgi:hypothetical protein
MISGPIPAGSPMVTAMSGFATNLPPESVNAYPVSILSLKKRAAEAAL